jgi:lysyl-tRNA synthetase class 2
MAHFLTEKHDRLKQRARILQSVRAFFIESAFLEVETPQRIPLNAPESNIAPLNSDDWQLQTSPELAMKRLLAAGYNNIFQISHCWRAEERGRRHLPEFTMLEWYRSHCDYRQLMTDCENLFRYLLPEHRIDYQGQKIMLDQPFERLSVTEAFARHTDIGPLQAIREDRFDELIAFSIEPKLGLKRPTILYDYPAELASLARCKPDHPELAERFELYIAGLELANAFSELTDPDEQRQRFALEAASICADGDDQKLLPEPFLADLHKMPPAAGIALGVDRLVMLLTDSCSIDQVVAFPPEAL